MGKKRKRAKEWYVHERDLRTPQGPFTHGEARRAAMAMASVGGDPALHRVVNDKTIKKLRPAFPALDRARRQA